MGCTIRMNYTPYFFLSITQVTKICDILLSCNSRKKYISYNAKEETNMKLNEKPKDMNFPKINECLSFIQDAFSGVNIYRKGGFKSVTCN